MWNSLKVKMSGKKTYAICALTVVYAVVSVLLHKMGMEDAVNLVLAALGGASLRAGMTKS